MIAVGVSSTVANLRNPMLRGRSVFTLLILLASMLFLPTVFLFLLAMMGAFYVIFDYKRTKAKQERNGSGSGED